MIVRCESIRESSASHDVDASHYWQVTFIDPNGNAHCTLTMRNRPRYAVGKKYDLLVEGEGE